MAQNFIPNDRDQLALMSHDLNEWLPADHLARFVIRTVKRLDLSAFYRVHRDDGWGRAAYDPKMMVTLLLYAYCTGVRSAREIERRCVENIAFRYIATHHRVDHATICRFRTRHRDALSELFVSVLGLCAEAGMVRPTIVAVDGTKLAANASANKNLTRDQLDEIARQVFDDAERIDQEEDELYGDKRGDEIPQHLTDPAALDEWIDQKLAEREQEARSDPKAKATPRVNTTDPDSALQRTAQGFIQGYNGQLAVTEDQVIVAAELTADNHDYDNLEPMIAQTKDNLDGTTDEAIGTVVADAGYFSTDNVNLDLGVDLLIAPVATRNLEKAIADRIEPTAIDDRELQRLHTQRAVADRRAAHRDDVIAAYVAKQVTVAEAMQALGISARHVYWLAWHLRKFGFTCSAKHPPPLPPRDSRQTMLKRFAAPGALQTYALRAQTVEPVFGQIKEARSMRRFLHRGKVACRCEWRMMATAHNLLKLWRGALKDSFALRRGLPVLPVAAATCL